MALPLMPILTGIGAVTGGIKGYQESGGDIGATALSALTGGAFTGGAGRLAKTGANKLLHSNPILSKVMQQGGPLSKALMISPEVAGLTTAGLVGLPAAATLSGKVGGATSNLVGQGAKAATGALGLASQATGIGQPGLPNLPGYDVNELVPTDLTSYQPGVVEYTNPLGYIQQQRQDETARYLERLNNAVAYANAQERFTERAKNTDLIRGSKAAQLATALATDSAMRRQGQLGAQEMAGNFLNNIGRAGATQYRYF